MVESRHASSSRDVRSQFAVDSYVVDSTGSSVMPLPRAKEAKPFYRAAFHRFDEAQFLEEGSRFTGAIYLAGYGVECILKALILVVVPARKRSDVLATFRGQRAHNFDWLRYQYLQNGGAQFPPDIAKAFHL
jgi:hypothetical protein